MSELEPSVRMAISNIQGAIRYASRFDRADYGHALDLFDHHAIEAIHQLREWAAANNIEIKDGMPT